jgi:hypothetical protein
VSEDECRVTEPRIVLQGDIWRVVALELPDAQGVLNIHHVIEWTDPSEKDLMGVQRWHELTGKSAMGDWVRVTRKFQDKLLRDAGETPDAKY